MERDYSIRDADTGKFTAGVEDDQGYEQQFRDVSVRPRAWRVAVAVMVLAAAAVLSGPYIIRKMMSKTHGIGWKTPEGYALQAASRAQASFPHRLQAAIAVEIACDASTSTVFTKEVADFSSMLVDRLHSDSRVSAYEAVAVGYYTDVLGYHPPEHMLRDMLVAKDGKTTLLLIQPTKEGAGSWSDAQNFLDELCVQPPKGYSVYITGMPAIASGGGCFSGMDPSTKLINIRNMNFEDLFIAEIFTMPLAILIMGFMVRYLWLLLLPLLAVAVSFIVGAALMTPLMDWIRVPTDVPAAMISVTMALSLDYSLFLLTRFSEQHMEGWPLQRNIDTLIKCTGRTITASGILIAIAFFGTVVLAEENLRGAGISLGMAAVACVVTSIAIIPAILLVTAGFFTTGCTAADVSLTVGAITKKVTASDSSEEGSGSPSEHGCSVERACAQEKVPEALKVMRFVERSPMRAIVLVALLMSPLLSYLPELRISGDRFAILPMDMPAVVALRHIEQSFSTGILDPYVVVIKSPALQVGVNEVATEIDTAAAELKPHHVKAVALKLGLSADAADKAAVAFNDLARGRDIDAAELKGLVDAIGIDHRTLASAAAGTSVFLQREKGATLGEAMRAAVRAARKAGGTSDDLKAAVAAAAAVLYGATPAHKGPAMESDVKDAVRQEAEKVGLSSKMAREVAKAAAEGARGAVDHMPLAAARAGSRSAMSKLGGLSDATSLSDALHEIEDAHISAVDIAKVLRAAAASIHELKDDAPAAGKLAPTDAATQDDQPHNLNKVNKHDVQTGIQHSADGLKMLSHDIASEVKKQALKQGFSRHAASIIGAAAMTITNTTSAGGAFHELDDDLAKQAREAGASETSIHDFKEVFKEVKGKAHEIHHKIEAKAAHEGIPFVIDMIDTIHRLSRGEHGSLLMPTGYDAMLDLCHAIQQVGQVSTLLGPMWAFQMEVDWVAAVALSMDAKLQHVYKPLLNTHVNGHEAMLEVHTNFPSIGAGGANWVLGARSALEQWEASHPGWKAELSGGASAAADTRTEVLHSMTTYLVTTISMILVVFFITFRSLLMPLRLFIALLFTLSATFGTAVIVYQTPTLHRFFPSLAHFDGLAFEVVPVATGIAIALGLDYDVFLVSRVVEFRMAGFSDRASIFRGSVKTGGVISSAGVIMVMAFSGLCFSNKLMLQQFGVLLIISVLFDTFIVRTILVPALMLMAQQWNWWPRRMPPPVHEALEGQICLDNGFQDLEVEDKCQDWGEPCASGRLIDAIDALE